ncbi:MAG: 2-phospho-L-lactate transferase [Promethearchaeota archaeon]
MNKESSIVILSGGVGGAKIVEGFYSILPKNKLGVIVNTGDDIYRYGLRICPDIDIVIYTLANIVNRQFHWGIGGDTFNALKYLSKFYHEPPWFQLGDMDLATHIFRTDMLRKGFSLSEVTDMIVSRFGLNLRVMPMAENYMPTYIITDLINAHNIDNKWESNASNYGEYANDRNFGAEHLNEAKRKLHFQEYFVKYRSLPKIRSIEYGGKREDISDLIQLPEGIISSLDSADKIIIAPSNPFLSIGPIIAIKEIKEALIRLKNKVIAITPIINNRAIKGPTVKIMKELNIKPSPLEVAKLYKDIIKKFVIDERDLNNDNFSRLIKDYEDIGIEVFPFDTLMTSLEKKRNLADFILNL